MNILRGFFLLTILISTIQQTASPVLAEDSFFRDFRIGLRSARGASVPSGRISSDGSGGKIVSVSPSYSYGVFFAFGISSFGEITFDSAYTFAPLELTRKRFAAASSTSVDAEFGEASIGWNFILHNFYFGPKISYFAALPGWRVINSVDGAVTGTVLYGKYSGCARSSIAAGAVAGYLFHLTPSIILSCGLEYIYTFDPVYVSGDDRLNLNRVNIQTGIHYRI